MEWCAVAVGCLVVGTCLGLSGYGGFLIPPLLIWALSLSPREAVAHALLASLLPALLGAVLYRRGHGLDLRLVLLLCAGTLPGVVAGELLSRAAPAWVLQALIGAAVLAAGVALVRPTRPLPAEGADIAQRPGGVLTRTAPARATTVGAGVLSGTSGVVVGVGGPLVTTPVLVAGGVALAPAVGAGLANNVVVAGVGSLSLLQHVSLDPIALAVITATQLVGVVLGVRWRALVPASLMSRAVAVVAVLTGATFLVAALT